MAARRSELQLAHHAELKALPGIRFSAILEMPEKELAHLVSILEGDPLFQKLFQTRDPRWKAISREKFPSGKWSSSFYELKEETSSTPSFSGELGDNLAKNEEIIELIQKIGRENFEIFFLYDNGEKSLSEIAQELKLNADTVRRIQEFTEKVLIHSDFSKSPAAPDGSASVSPELRLNYNAVAAYRPKPDGEFEIEFYSPLMARGTYRIHYEKLQRLKQEGSLNSPEKKRLQELVKWIELINSRRRLIFKILQALPSLQKDFFRSGERERLAPVTQRMLSLKLKVTPSAVNRAIKNRSVRLPSGAEFPLTDFLPSQKQVLKRKVAALIAGQNHLSDEALRKLILQKFGVPLSRRSVNVYRNEINFSSA